MTAGGQKRETEKGGTEKGDKGEREQKRLENRTD